MNTNNTSLEEHKLLVSAENDIVKYGKTDKKCPRCGNSIIIEEGTSSYCVKYKTKNCVIAEFRGI